MHGIPSSSSVQTTYMYIFIKRLAILVPLYILKSSHLALFYYSLALEL